LSGVFLPASDDPLASVLILCRRNYPLLESCLASLSRNVGAEIRYEVLVLLNDAEPDVLAQLRRRVSGVQTLVSNVNLGFSGGNNRAATRARGEYLVLLNDDTEVQPGWLESLLETAEAHPRAGAVGSRILFPNGRLQEAGSVIWSDGTTSPVGRGLPAGSRAYSYLRPVDYSSACSLLVRRSTWDAVGGFDEEYAPGYYEDADLCLAIGDRGEEVIYEPRSRVLHHESTSSDLRFKQFLFRRNVERIRVKWAAQLRTYEPPPNPPAPGRFERAIHRTRGCPPRVLAIDKRIPEERLGTGYPRLLDALRALATHFAVAFHPWYRIDGDFTELGNLGVDLVEEDIMKHLRRPGVIYDAVIVSRPEEVRPFIDAVRLYQPTAALIYDVEALNYRRFEGQAAVSDDPIEADWFASRAKSSRALEEAIPREVDQIVCLSSEEADILRQVDGHAPIDVVEQFRPAARRTARSFVDRQDMLFVAGWQSGPRSPNVDGLRWFADEVLPRIKHRVPWARLVVTGEDPPSVVRDLEGPSVCFVGYVESLYDLYDAARVVVIPIRYGAGVKMKATEALQFEVPTVSTTIGVEGIGADRLRAVTVTDDPAFFAAEVAQLLNDHDSWETRRAKLLTAPAPQTDSRRWRDVVRAAMMRRVT
jgi:GT2 family glycosyltransferase